MAQPVLPVSAQSEINGLYVALYDVPATEAGFQYWLNVLEAKDPSITGAGSAISTADAQYLGVQMTANAPVVNGATYFATLYPSTITDVQYVEDLYQNAAGFSGTGAGIQYWTTQLQALEAGGDSVQSAREAIAGQFVQAFLENNLSLGAAYWGLNQTDYAALVAGQQALLNKIEVSEYWAVNSSADNGLLNYTASDLNGTVPLGPNNPFSAGMHLNGTISSNPTSVVNAENAINAALKQDSLTPIDNVSPTFPGQTYDLTTGIDNIQIATVGTVDHVEGLIDTTSGSTDSTYTVGDSVQGNGLTVVDLAVDGSGNATNAALATLTNVSTVNFFMGSDTDLTVNASLWSGVNNLTVTGEGTSSDTVTVNNLDVTNGNGLFLSINTTDESYLKVNSSSAPGHLSGLSFYADLKSGKGVGTVANFSLNGINAAVGKSGYLSGALYQSVDHGAAAKGAASVGDLTLGNISVNVAADGEVNDLYVYNYAKAVSHDATVGNLTVGNVNVTVAAGGNGYDAPDIYNEAYVDGGTGNATAGNMTIGNVSLQHTGKTGELYGYAENSAYVYGNGNASVGTMTIGNVSLMGNSYGAFEAGNYAYVEANGNASAGDVTVGNISVVKGTVYDEQQYVDIYNEAYAEGKGNATVGNISAGNVNMAAQNYYGEVSLYNEAYVYKTGAATAGSIGVGNVTMNGNVAGSNYFYVYNEAEVSNGGKGGAATAGGVTLGTLVMNVGSGENEVYIDQYAYNYGTKAGDAIAGNVTIGNIAMSDAIGLTKSGHLPLTGGDNYLSVYNEAYTEHGNGTVGNVSLGNISINAGAVTLQTGSYNEIRVENGASALHGVATAGTVTIGNITADVGVGGEVKVDVSSYAQGASSADKTGLITVGNVSVNGGSGANMYVTVENFAYKSGTAGGITIGNVSLHESKLAGTAALHVEQTGHIAGQISVGNIAITDHKATLFIENEATGPGAVAGAIGVGNITLNLLGGADTAALNSTIESYAKAAGGNTGAITIGDVSLSDHKSQDLVLNVYDDAGNKAGAVSVGNVAIAVASTNASTKVADVTLKVDTNSTTAHKTGSGSITTGNITVGSSGDTTKGSHVNMAAHVTLDSVDGAVTVGNITVSGGVANHAGTAALDNFAHFSNGADGLATWFNAPGSSVTVGNIDYSGYAGVGAYANGTVDGITANTGGTLIDVSGLKGAASIVGASGGTAIVSNTGTDAIDVSHATKGDIILLQENPTAVTDSGGVVTAAQSAVDSITGIHSGDVIGFAAGNFSTGTGLVGSTPASQAANMTYANFLLNAEQAIDASHDAFFSGNVNGNTYVAMNDANNHVDQIVEVTGVHTFTLDTHGFLHYAT